MVGALEGITVVDFGCFIAGPLLGERLAQNGANVVRVDPPGGPKLSGLPDAYLNRGKRRLTLDLRKGEDLRVAQDLARAADVVVENFRPGVMQQMGLGSEQILATNPGLVYCSLPGFAADDPRASMPGWEGIVMSATAGYRRLDEHWDWKARANVDTGDPGRPLFTSLPIASTTAAMLGAVRVVAALLQRNRTGRGAWIEVPLAEAMLEVVGFHLEFPDFVGPRVDLPRPFLGSYRCADDRFVDQVSYPRFVERFLKAAGVWDSWREAGLSDMSAVFTDPELRRLGEQRFTQLIRDRPAAHWESLASELGIPFALVRTPTEWLANDHARQSGAVIDLDDPEFGPLSMAGIAMHFSETPAHISARLLPSAKPGGTAGEILARSRTNDVGSASEDGGPLNGISVLELSQVVAGPITGRLLADCGANVLKVANPHPGGNNGFHGSYTNRGKRTALLDVQDPADLGHLRGALDDADVFLQNYAFGAIARYGLGFEQLKDTRPDLVYVSLSAFSEHGPWRHRRGHENQAVAATGLSSRYGGPGAWPIYQPYLISDVGTGIMGALATVLGLYRRSQSGRGQHISTSLSHIASMHQAIYLFGGETASQSTEPTGPGAVGWSARERLYQAADGWLFLSASADDTDQLFKVFGIVDTFDETVESDGPHGPVANAVAAAIRMHTREHWIDRLGANGIAAQAVREISDVAHDPTWHRRGILRYHLNGEARDCVPVLGMGSAPWPASKGSAQHPGTLGTHTSAVRAQYPSDTRPTTLRNDHAQ